MTLEFRANRTLGPFQYAANLDAAHEIVVLYGHSGAGKSLTLQIAAGLMKPDAGRIVVDGTVVFDDSQGIDLPPQRRHTGYVVQELALFERMTVEENVRFGMPSGIDRPRRAAELMALLEIGDLGQRRPRTLSGGQRQRVALARALGREAKLLLLDEPFSALDDQLRSSLRRELLRLRSELGLTILFVTHDLREAHLLADRIAVFDGGHVLQFGPREEVFRRPASRRVARLTGVANVWPGRVVAHGPGTIDVEVAGARLRAAHPPGAPHLAAGADVDVILRSERVGLRRDMNADPQGRNLLPGRVTAEYAYGSSHTLLLSPEGAGPELECDIAARPYEVLGVGHRTLFNIEIDPSDLHVVARDIADD